MRMCIDHRTINSFMKKDWYPLPHIEELVQPLGESSYLSKFDLASGYYQIRICVGDGAKMTFSTKYGLYKWMVLRFELANTPS